MSAIPTAVVPRVAGLLQKARHQEIGEDRAGSKAARTGHTE